MLILASSSPRRKQLIKKLTTDFLAVKPLVDERACIAPVTSYALELSKLKAYEVATRYPNDKVLACDTVVIFDNKIINKPKNNEDAMKILRMLSGKEHVVISGYTYIDKNNEINRSIKTRVIMNKLSDDLIKEYVMKGYAKDKAGAYGIQDPYPLVNHIEGSFDNVMGFPTEDIIKHLKNKLL